MAKGLITHAYLEDTADAIRVLRGESDTYTPNEFGEKILDAIPTEEVTDDIVSVTDAAAYPAEGLEFAIEPVQDLHGYDKPWPGGGGKNKSPWLIDVLKSQNTDGTWTGNNYVLGGITFACSVNEDGAVTKITANGTADRDPLLYLNYTIPAGSYILSGCPSGGSLSNSYSVRIANTATQTQYAQDIGAGVSFTLDAATPSKMYCLFNSRSVANNVVFYPMVRLASDTDPTFVPYANICPISGWTGVNGERTGANVWDEQWEGGGYDNNGNKVANQFVIRAKNKIKVNPNTTYKFVFPSIINSTPVTYRLCQYTLDEICISSSSGLSEHTFTTNAKCQYITFNFGPEYGTTYNHDISINYPATDTEYHTYQGTSILITFPTEAGTVYGGKVDVVNGKLTVTYASVDLGTPNWIYENNFSIFRSSSTNYKKVPNSSVGNIKCSIYPSISADAILQRTLSDSAIAIGNVGAYDNNFIVKNLSYTDVAAFKTAMSGVQLVYELATPIEYDITPQQVQMLLGNNNIWCDTGDTTLEYKVDLGRFIAKLQAAQAPQLSLSRQAVSLDAAGDDTAQNEDEAGDLR